MTEQYNKHDCLHQPRTGLTTQASLTAPSDALPRRQPARLRDTRRRSSVAVGVRSTLAHFLDARIVHARVSKEEDLGMERLVLG